MTLEKQSYARLGLMYHSFITTLRSLNQGCLAVIDPIYLGSQNRKPTHCYWPPNSDFDCVEPNRRQHTEENPVCSAGACTLNSVLVTNEFLQASRARSPLSGCTARRGRHDGGSPIRVCPIAGVLEILGEYPHSQ